MSAELLEILPQELKFVFELKKQSSCSVRLVNKSNHHVAFKVKTTSPKKYCVRPNTGIIKPKSTCDFIVTMQGQRETPPDMICKDKFLLQSTVVPVGTSDEDIEPSTFTKDDGKYVEEKKLRVILVSPPNSPVLSPINGTLKHVPAYEATKLKDQVLSRIENLSPHHTPREATTLKDQVLSRIENLSPHHTPRDSPITLVENLSPHHTVIEHVEAANMENGEELEPVKDVEFKTMKDVEEMKLIKDIEEMKLKLNEFESKLSEAEVTISKLTEERRLTTHERESLRQEVTLLRSKKGLRKVQAGFPLLFVCMVALVSVILGYLLHR